MIALDGFQQLLGSKKGAALGATSLLLVGMMAEGRLEPALCAQLVAGVAAAHAIGQGLADFGKGKAETEHEKPSSNPHS